MSDCLLFQHWTPFPHHLFPGPSTQHLFSLPPSLLNVVLTTSRMMYLTGAFLRIESVQTLGQPVWLPVKLLRDWWQFVYPFWNSFFIYSFVCLFCFCCVFFWFLFLFPFCLLNEAHWTNDSDVYTALQVRGPKELF